MSHFNHLSILKENIQDMNEFSTMSEIVDYINKPENKAERTIIMKKLSLLIIKVIFGYFNIKDVDFIQDFDYEIEGSINHTFFKEGSNDEPDHEKFGETLQSTLRIMNPLNEIIIEPLDSISNILFRNFHLL